MIFVVIYKVFPYKIGEPGSVLSCGWYMLLCVAFLWCACMWLLPVRWCVAALLYRNAKRSDYNNPTFNLVNILYIIKPILRL